MVTTNLDKVTVRAQYLDFDGFPMAGTVVFTPSTTVIDVAGKKILFPKQYSASLDSNGNIMVQIPASDDPDILPNIFTYRIVENIVGGRTFDHIQIPYSAMANGFNLSTVLIDGTVIDPPTYVGGPGIQGQQGPAGVAGAAGAQGAPGPTGATGPSGGGNSSVVDVMSYAAGDGVTIDTGAIQTASDLAISLGRTLYFPGNKTYLVDIPSGYTRSIILQSGAKWSCGAGATIKLKNSAGSFFTLLGGGPSNATYGTELNNVTIDGLTFDMNNTNNLITSTLATNKTPRDLFGEPPYTTFKYQPRMVLTTGGGDNIKFTNCTVRDLDCIQALYLGAYDSYNIVVNDNFFTDMGQSAVYHDNSVVYLNARYGIQCNNNIFKAKAVASNGARCAIETHGGGQSITGNTVEDFAKIVNATGWADNVENSGIIVKGNTLKNGFWGIDVWSYNTNAAYGARDVIISENVVNLDRDLWYDVLTAYATLAGFSPVTTTVGISCNPTSTAKFDNLVISGNIVRFAATTVKAYTNVNDQETAGILLKGKAPYTLLNENIKVHNNLIVNSPAGGIRCQLKVRNMEVTNNTIINPGNLNDANMANYRRGIIVFATSSDGQPAYQNAFFDSNNVIDTRVSPLTTGHIFFFDTVSTQFVNVTVGNCYGTNTNIVLPSNGTILVNTGLTDIIVNAVMDGVTDGTAALATAAAAAQASTTGGSIYIPSGKLLVKDTTTITGNNIRVRGPGQIIMSNSPNAGTTLKSAGLVFYVNGATGVSISVDIKAPTSMTNYALAGVPAVIMLNNTIECNVQYSRMTGFAATGILTGIMVNGPSADSNKITSNRLDGVGIAYSYSGANRTTCCLNTVINSPNNSLGCVGPVTGYATDNKVLDNIVINCGRFGIEDYGTTDRTIIRGNTIDGVGALESGMGISAVGRNCIVSENTIANVDGTYGIEMASNGNRCVHNNVKQITAGLIGVGTGIIINNHDTGELVKGAIVEGNTVHNFGTLIGSLSVLGTIVVTNNQLNNPKTVGISIDTVDTTSSIIIANNSIRVVTINTADRILFSIFSTAAAGAFGCQIIGNHVFYESTATGGPGIEYLVKPGTNDILVHGNVFDGGGVVNGTIGPTIYSGGSVLSGFRLIDNTFRGGSNGNLQFLTAPEVRGNKGVTFATATDNRLGFYQAQGSPIVKPTVTGSRGSNAALASLMTALANLGLVTDSTS